MADSGHASALTAYTPPPPPPPPLPPSRAGGVFQKFIAPLSFNIGARPHGNQTSHSTGVSPSTASNRNARNSTSQTTRHRTNIPIAAVDTNKARTHAILAGHEILKTVHVQDGRVEEDFNLRASINSHASLHPARSEIVNNRREYLPAKDVVWSKGDKYDTIIATAALNGRIALYDVNRTDGSRVELAWIHEHTGQVHKLDFDPTGGYLLLSGSSDKTVRVWDIRDAQSVKRRQSFNIRQPVRDVRWSPTDPGEFALCTESGVIQRWDLRMPSGAVLSINNAHEKPCYAIDWHPDGRHLVSGGFDKHVRVWDLKSENRRQKPVLELRAPQAVLCVRWRPPSWSTSVSEKGQWQSAQLATSYTTSYTDDDPRIHIWDLRRPFLPFLEIDRYNRGPSDVVWASEHFLWSVGSEGMFEGMFTQHDVRYASLVQDELLMSAIDFMPDGGYIAFSEDIRARRTPVSEDATVSFLRVPQERLSGGTDGAISRSFSDEDEGEDGLLTAAVRRRVARSVRSTKSQGNTPPTGDGLSNIIPLDRSVLTRNGLFANEQVGAASSITGVSVDADMIEFLAENYAKPAMLQDCKSDPSMILQNLQQAFDRNASVCDYLSLHRTAQTWRMLNAVVIPELEDWADANRKQRLRAEAGRQISSDALQKPEKGPMRDIQISKAKVMSNLFRGVTESSRHGSEFESTSNMTTPMAKPLPDSPSQSSPDRREHTFLSFNETIEPIPPLPPSVMSSHSTAEAASKALLDMPVDDSPASSPEAPRRITVSPQRHKRNVTDIPISSFGGSKQLQSPNLQPAARRIPSSVAHPSPRMELRKQEDRRAAIRDFRAQQRQLFTLEEPIKSPTYSISGRHDSSESFNMFSLSTESSHRTKSLGQSFDLLKPQPRGTRGAEEQQRTQARDAMEFSQPSSDGDSSNPPDRDLQRMNSEDGSMHEYFPMDETSQMDFQSDEALVSKRKSEQLKASAAARIWDVGEILPQSLSSQSETAASSGSDMFHFEETSNAQRPRIYISNPIRKIATKTEPKDDLGLDASNFPADEEEMGSREYILSDFRPLDFTTYEPKLPFAWSALPLICHSIAFDVSEGIANAQFSAHLLMHLHPFFFNPATRVQVQSGTSLPYSIAEKLMRPDLSHRIIEGIFLNHYLFLKRIGLYRPMAELRKVCVDLGFGDTFQPSSSSQSVGASLQQDPYQLQISCSHCNSLMYLGSLVCHTCGRPRDGCPICLQLDVTLSADNSEPTVYNNPTPTQPSLWSFCQSCGHGAHWSCMQQWLLEPDTEGECPTRSCGCDCGPGLVRQRRIARQLADAELPELIRGSRNSSSVTKKDPHRASHSPAVDKTRDTLRHVSVSGGGGGGDPSTPRDSSGDERVRRSFTSRSSTGRTSRSGLGLGGASQGQGQSFGRRVRLVTPGEESANPSYSAS